MLVGFTTSDGKRVLCVIIFAAKKLEQGGQTMTQITNFGDYRVVKGVKVPFNIIQNVGFELNIKMSDVKINEGVSDADFK